MEVKKTIWLWTIIGIAVCGFLGAQLGVALSMIVNIEGFSVIGLLLGSSFGGIFTYISSEKVGGEPPSWLYKSKKPIIAQPSKPVITSIPAMQNIAKLDVTARVKQKIKRDLLFACPNCSKHLVMDDEGAGRTIKCPDCQESIVTPKPSIFFKCSSCNCYLSAPSEMEGKVRECPNCQKDVILQVGMKEGKTYTCPKCSGDLLINENEIDTSTDRMVQCLQCNATIKITAKQPNSSSSNCPKCGLIASADACYCQKCGTNIKSGYQPPLPNHDKLKIKTNEPGGVRSKPMSYGLVYGEQQETADTLCPYCKNPLPADAVLCVHCGTDLKTGRQLQPAKKGNRSFSYGRDFGGIGRLWYWIMPLGIGFVGMFLMPVVGLPITVLILIIVTFFLHAARLQNIGINPWLALLMFIPIGNIVVLYWCSVYPEGYEDNKKMDTAGHILGGLLIISILFCSIWTVSMMCLYGQQFFSSFGDIPSVSSTSNHSRKEILSSSEISRLAEEKVGKAYMAGYKVGLGYGKLDKNYGSFDNMAKSQTDVLGASLLLSEAHIQRGSNESGDFWEGFDEGYQSARNGINSGKFWDALDIYASQGRE